MDQSFGKDQKLKSKKQIEKLFKEGKSLKAFPLKLIYTPITSREIELKTAVSVPKKLIKTAVHRNRIKRLIREVFRKNKYIVHNRLTGSYAFMFIFLNREEKDYKQLETAMLKIMKAFNEKTYENEEKSI